MSAFYNEIEPYAAEWMRNLATKGHIADGVVDERSIRTVSDADLASHTQCHFFAGLGGWSYALRLAGWPDNRPVWTGSCPCQPFSSAGRRKGVADDRHLWPDWFRLIRERHPPVIFGEQVASPDGLSWFDVVSTDLEGAGYAVGAADLCAASVGAPHIRQRLYWVAVAECPGNADARQGETDRATERVQGTDGQRERVWTHIGKRRDDVCRWDCSWLPCLDGKQRPVEPGTSPLAYGFPSRVGRVRAYGNAIVPEVAATFIQAVMEAM